MRLVAGEWLPDVPRRGNPGLVDARNAIPLATHWHSMPFTQRIETDSLPAPAQGLFVARRSSGDAIQIFGGGDKLYLLSGETLTDISRDGGTYLFQPVDRWRSVQFGSQLILTNFRDKIQVADVNAGVIGFDDLSENAPRAKYIAQVRNLPMVAYTFDDIDGEDAFRIRWPGFTDGLPDLDAWAPSLTTQADFRRIPNLGVITGLTGGQFGTVLCEKGVVRVSEGGGTYLYQVDTIEDEIGCNAPGSVVKYGQHTYFWSDHGWHRFNGQAVENIGFNRIDQWFEQDADHGAMDSMWAYPLYEFGVIAWLYAGSGNEDGKPNRLLLYNPHVNQWGRVDLDNVNLHMDILGPVVTGGLDLDDETEFPDLDTDERDLDDPRLWTSSIRSGTVDDNDLRAFTGTAMPAEFEFSELELVEGQRAILTRGDVVHEGGIAEIAIGTRERQDNSTVWSSWMSRLSDGLYRFRQPGRRHRVRVRMTGDWREFQAADVWGAPLGQR